MINSFKNRTIDTNQPVQVYRNLHTGTWSIKQNGLVVAHATAITLSACEFIVNESGRQRVIQEQRKNVHAMIKGYVAAPMEPNDRYRTVSYNPYKAGNFTANDAPIHSAGFVILHERGVQA